MNEIKNLKEYLANLSREEIDKTIKCLKDYKKAHFNLLEVFYSNEILNLCDSLKYYPFNQSFDDIDVDTWIDETIAEIQANIQ